MFNSKIAIIGAGGFLGSSLVDYFNNYKTHLVLYVKSDFSYIKENHNIIEIGSVKGESIDLKYLFDVDIIYYLIGGDFKNNISINEQIALNVHILEDFLFGLPKFCKKLPKFVFFSSAGTVYGSNKDYVNETTPVNPFGSYGQIKFILENKIIEISRLLSVPYLILRISNPYGIKQINNKSNGLIVNLIKNLHLGNLINLPLDLDVYRDYMFIDDFLIIIDKITFSECIGLYNISTGISVSIKNILQLLESKGMPISNYNVANYESGVKYNFVSNQKLQNDVGHFNFTSVSDGIDIVDRCLNVKR